jgi:hypothetical protein
MGIPFNGFRDDNPNIGCKYLTQRRDGAEKARKESTSKNENSHPLRLSFVWVIDPKIFYSCYNDV